MQWFKTYFREERCESRILHWSLILHGFDYDLEHRKSERMKHVDALSLSRCIMILEESSTFEDSLCVLQDKDKDITKIKCKLISSENSFYELRSGLIHKKLGDKILFYVPASMQMNVIKTCYDEVGHVGIDTTVSLITNTYWFPNMRKSVKNYMQNCLKCLVYSPLEGKKQGFLHNITKGDLPFQTLHVDHYGPLERTSRKKKQVFEIIDAFTKFVRL